MSKRLNINDLDKMMIQLNKLDKDLHSLQESIIGKRLRINDLFWKIIDLKKTNTVHYS